MDDKYCAIIQEPLKPTWKRYKKIFIDDSELSIYRALEYELLSKIEYKGNILDLGGGENAHYKSLFSNWGNEIIYESVNIDPNMDPTYIGDANADLGVPQNHYDMVISFNSLEHIYDIDNALTQIRGATKPGGRLVIAVPFMYRIHAHPFDYHRPTAEWWIETLKRKGLISVNIQPILWDVYTSGLSLTEGKGIWHRIRRVIVPLYGILYGYLCAGISSKQYPKRVSDNISAFALGYIITATKPEHS